MTESTFLEHPGQTGAFGALMDEYARAAEDLCRVVETITLERFAETRPSGDPDTASIRAVCAHAVGAAHRYADYIRQARGDTVNEIFQFPSERLHAPGEVRGHLREALRDTESALRGLYQAKEEEVAAMKVQVRWGPIYDPEMLLEHAIVHLLRHRRQLERWR